MLLVAILKIKHMRGKFSRMQAEKIFCGSGVLHAFLNLVLYSKAALFVQEKVMLHKKLLITKIHAASLSILVVLQARPRESC